MSELAKRLRAFADANMPGSAVCTAAADRITELEARLVAAQSLHDKTVTLYDYLLETDEEGLIHHATQMRDVCLAVHEYRSADPSFDKEPK